LARHSSASDDESEVHGPSAGTQGLNGASALIANPVGVEHESAQDRASDIAWDFALFRMPESLDGVASTSPR
jgi:hypothetical protein